MPEKLEMEEIVERITDYEGWEQQGVQLTKRFEFDDFAAAIEFVNAVGEVAEELDHHPDIAVQNFNEVVLWITTHDMNAITDEDFAFVDRVEEVV